LRSCNDDAHRRLEVRRARTEAVIATADAAAAENLIAPFELMVRHGKNLPVEAWDAF
jgi:hypothetical protein